MIEALVRGSRSALLVMALFGGPKFDAAGWSAVRWEMSPAEAGSALEKAGIAVRRDELRGYFAGEAGHRNYPMLIATAKDGWEATIRFDQYGEMESISAIRAVASPEDGTKEMLALEKRWGKAPERDAELEGWDPKVHAWRWRNETTVVTAYVLESPPGVWKAYQQFGRTAKPIAPKVR